MIAERWRPKHVHPLTDDARRGESRPMWPDHFPRKGRNMAMFDQVRRLARPPRRGIVVGVSAATTAALIGFAISSAGANPTTDHHRRGPTPVVLYSSDGMRPDLMQRYAAQGVMPTYAGLMREGATGDNGLTQGFPPNTGQGWYTMATGAGPGVHGSTNNTFFDTRQPFTASTSFAFHGNGASPGTDPTNVLEAESVASAAELAGKTVAQLEWTGGLNANINGPTVDFDTFFSTRGLLEFPANATKQASAASFGLSYQVAAFAPASDWTNVPASNGVAAQQTVLTV